MTLPQVHTNILSSASPFSSPHQSPTSPPSTLTSHFVQALHDYLPSNKNEDVSCLYFKKGSIIEVFNRDNSGWWDGQLGDVRGWFPSNYVGRIGEAVRSHSDFEDEEDDESTRKLELWRQKQHQKYLSSIESVGGDDFAVSLEDSTKHLSTSTLIQSRDDQENGSLFNADVQMSTLMDDMAQKVSDLVDSYSQPLNVNTQLNVFRVVSCVRSLLTHANMVDKSSPLLKIYPELARQRKIVLSALSRLILKGKEIQSEDNNSRIITGEEHNTNNTNNTTTVNHTITTTTTTYSNNNNDTTNNNNNDNNDRSNGNSNHMDNNINTDVDTDIDISNDNFNKDLVTTPVLSLSTSTTSSSAASASASSPTTTTTTQQQSVENKSNTHNLEVDQISYFADRLLNEIDIFENMLTSIPRDSVTTIDSYMNHSTSSFFYDSNDNNSTTTPHSSIHYYPSTSSLERIPTNSSSSLPLSRQHITEKRHSSLSLFSIVGDADRILQAILDHQTSIDELMSTFMMTLERFLENKKKRAAEMLEMTRRLVDAVRTFLSVVEHVCSNVGDFDHRRSWIDDSHSDLIALALAKEYVYSAITNLVTAVRALTSNDSNSSNSKEDFGHLEICCENVIHTTNECAGCVRICLQEETMRLYYEQQQQQSSNESLGLDYKQLSVLGKKMESLKALQQQYYPLSGLSEETALYQQEDDIDMTPDMMIKETNQYRKELQHSIKKNADSLYQTKVKPSISDSAIQSTYRYHRTSYTTKKKDTSSLMGKARPRAASLDSLYRANHTQLMMNQTSKMGHHPMAAVFPLPPSSTTGAVHNKNSSVENNIVKENMQSKEIDEQVKKNKEAEHLFLRQCIFSDDEMMFNAEGEVTGATIEALVRKLTLHEKSPDLIFTRAFFYNFRIFTTPDVFVDLLKKRFTLAPPTELNDEQLTIWNNRVLLPIRLRVYNVIKTWLENYFNFEEDAGVEKVLLDFATGDMENAMPGPAKRMVELINKTFSSRGLSCTGRKHTFVDTRLSTTASHHSSTSNTSPMSTNSNSNNLHISLGSSSLFSNWSGGLSDHDLEKPPTTIITKSLRNNLRKALHQNQLGLVHVHDIDPIELARQITVMESSLFCRIRPNEMVGQEFKKRSGKSTAVHVRAMIQRSTQITNWVCDTILKETDTKKRVQMLKYWIKVGDVCLQLNNYNTLMAIRSALDSTSIIRLRKTWEHLSAKYKLLWEPIHRATDAQRNFAEYRQRLKTAVAPCLPFLGVYLTDLTFIHDGNPDSRQSPSGQSLINFDKYIKVTRILSDIDQFQIGYRFLEIDEIQTFILRTLELVEQDDQVFYTLSLKREPKEEHSDI